MSRGTFAPGERVEVAIAPATVQTPATFAPGIVRDADERGSWFRVELDGGASIDAHVSALRHRSEVANA